MTNKYAFSTQDTKNPKVSHENRVTYFSKLHPVHAVSVCHRILGSADCTVQRRSNPVEYGTPEIHPAHKLKIIRAARAIGNDIEDGFV